MSALSCLQNNMFYLLKRTQVFHLSFFSPLLPNSANKIITSRMQSSLDFSKLFRVGKSALCVCNLPEHGKYFGSLLISSMAALRIF